MKLMIDVTGIPGAQGSKRHVGNGRMVESSKKVKPWRSDVKAAADAALLASDEWELGHRGPVTVDLNFDFPRPASHYGTGRNANLLRGTAPEHPTGKNLGDIDKLQRSTFDALVSAGVIHDDSQIWAVTVAKAWGRVGGASIEVHG